MSATTPRYSKKQEILSALDDDLDRYLEDAYTRRASPTVAAAESMIAPPPSPVPPLLTLDQTLLNDIYQRLDYNNWLASGPDDYDTVDDTITATQESRYRFSPFVLWSVTVLNNAASGGANLLFRLTDSYGRIKQYKIPPGIDFSLKDIRGSMGDVFRVVTDKGSAEMIAWVSLKTQYGQQRAYISR